MNAMRTTTYDRVLHGLTLSSPAFIVCLMLNGQAHALAPAANTQPEQTRHHSVGLTQAYEFREFASITAHAIMTATGEQLETEALRARALRDANTVWQTSQDESRVCRGVGKPKGVTARNDASRKPASARRGATPLGPAPTA